MPSQALALALAASIYPPAVAAVIGLGRGEQVRTRVCVFVLASLLTTYALGVAILYVLRDVGATGRHHVTPSAAVETGLGLLLIALAIHLRRGARRAPSGSKAKGPSRTERYLQSRRLAFVLGITLYVLPSPIYIGAVKSVADASLSSSGRLIAVAVLAGAMLWMIEVPMVMLLLRPERSARMLEQINHWFARNGRGLAVILAGAAGAYLAVKGLVDLIT